MCEHFIESGADHTDQENDNNKYYLILLSIFIDTFFLIDCTDKTESSKGVTNTCYMLSRPILSSQSLSLSILCFLVYNVTRFQMIDDGIENFF